MFGGLQGAPKKARPTSKIPFKGNTENKARKLPSFWGGEKANAEYSLELVRNSGGKWPKALNARILVLRPCFASSKQVPKMVTKAGDQVA